MSWRPSPALRESIFFRFCANIRKPRVWSPTRSTTTSRSGSLSDLDRISKADPEFAPKLTELRKVFQSHVRDEKKELLPAVRKALSSEEAQAVVEKIEAGRAEAEQEKKSGADGPKGEPKSAGGASENSAARFPMRPAR